MDLNEFAVDPAMYEGGKRVEFGDGTYVGVRSMGSERAQKVRERLWKPYASWTDVPAHVLDKLNAAWVAQGLLTEMVGFTLDGADLSVDLTKEEDRKRLTVILEAPKMKGFRSRIISVGANESNYQAQVDEVLEKNSDSSPAGSSSGANKQSA